MYAHARPAIHAETDGSLESSVSAPIIFDTLHVSVFKKYTRYRIMLKDSKIQS